jgi:hypothetical protein
MNAKEHAMNLRFILKKLFLVKKMQKYFLIRAGINTKSGKLTKAYSHKN